MNRCEILREISHAVSDETDTPAVSLSPTSTAGDIPGWDSLAHVRIVYNLEARLAVALDVTDTYKVNNVGALADLLLARIDGKEK